MNRQYTFITILFVFFFYKTTAQKLSVTDQKAKTEEEFKTDSWTAHLDQDVNAAENSLEDWVEDYLKLKLNKRMKHIYSIDKIHRAEITDLRMDIRIIVEAEGTGSMVSFIFSPGYDVYLSNSLYVDEYKKAQAFVKNYVRFHYNAFYNNVIKKLQEDIAEKQEDIKTIEGKIEKTKATLSENNLKIETNDPEASKLKDKNKKLYKDIEDRHSEISALKADIARLEYEITKANESLKNVAAFI